MSNFYNNLNSFRNDNTQRRIVCYYGIEPRNYGSEELTDMERKFLRAINARNPDLQLYSAKATYGAFNYPAFRIRKPNFGYAEVFFPFDLRGKCLIWIIHINPSAQGNYWKFKRFLDEITGIVFEATDVKEIYGRAEDNQFPVRQKKDWRFTKDASGKTKLVRLYEMAGIESDGETVTLTRERWETLHKATRKRFAEPGKALAPH